MSIFQAVFLGFLQGVTEFLPISSSAHLVIVPQIFGWTSLNAKTSLNIGFDIALHFGSLIALIAYFRKELLFLLVSLKPGKDKKLLLLLAVASVPALFVGVLFEKFFEGIFDKPIISAYLLLITGLILFLAEKIKWKSNKSINELKPVHSLIIGIGQAIAIFPGISRSGTTISFGLSQGLTREEAARFSFLLAIPAIAGAAFVTVIKGDFTIGMPWLAGFLASVITSYIVIKYFLEYVKTRSLLIFAYYCWAAGMIFVVLIKTTT